MTLKVLLTSQRGTSWDWRCPAPAQAAVCGLNWPPMCQTLGCSEITLPKRNSRDLLFQSTALLYVLLPGVEHASHKKSRVLSGPACESEPYTRLLAHLPVLSPRARVLSHLSSVLQHLHTHYPPATRTVWVVLFLLSGVPLFLPHTIPVTLSPYICLLYSPEIEDSYSKAHSQGSRHGTTENIWPPS